jgi:hypothetical protein
MSGPDLPLFFSMIALLVTTVYLILTNGDAND